MKCQGEKPNLKTRKSGQSANDLIFQPRISTILHNGWWCMASWDLKPVSNPTLRSNEKAIWEPNPPETQLDMHHLLGCVIH
jgi:hypothetical protein